MRPGLRLLLGLCAAGCARAWEAPLRTAHARRPPCPRPLRLSRHPPAAMGLDIGIALYEAQLAAERAVAANMQQLTPASALVLYSAGLVTSFSPCALSMVPVTIGFMGGLQSGEGAGKTSALPAVSYALGLACALSALGASAAALGQVYGQLSGSPTVLPLLVSVLAIAMGLNLLEVLSFQLPEVDLRASGLNLPPSVKAFALGVSSAFLSSPCVSPVLATILGFVATTEEPLIGGLFLLAFTLGFTTPVLLAGLLTGSISEYYANFEWVPPASGSALIAVGVYSGLTCVFGPA